MKNESDKADHSHLQHEAEHVKPTKNLSVMSYLTILFGVAFLLMLLSYFMQQRTSNEALGNQQDITVNAMKSIEELRADNDSLLKETQSLKDELGKQTALTAMIEQTAITAQSELDQAQAQAVALNYLNQIRTLYNQKKVTAAKSVVAEAEEATTTNGGMEEILGWVSAGLTEDARKIYDPLEAYRSLLSWLN